MKRHFPSLFLIVFVSLFCMKALFVPGLFTAHDIWHQVARLYWYHESLSLGSFPPSWIAPLANGYGYPLFVFSYHLPWMIGSPLVSLGFSIETTLKLLFVFSFLTSGWGMYWCSYLFTKNRFVATISALLYLIAPWRFVTIFVSAAMGRAFVFALFPFAVIGVYYIAKTKFVNRGIFLLGFSMAGIILSHLISAITVCLILLPIIPIVRPPFKKLALSALICFVLTAWYLVPLVQLSQTIKVSQEPFKSLYLNQFVTIKQLLYSPWGYGIVTNSAHDGPFSFQLGFAQWAVLGLTGLILFRNRANISKKQETQQLLFLLLATAACLILVQDISKPIWELASKFSTFDYPTMFLMPALFLSSLLCAFVLKQFPHKQKLLGCSFVFLALINNRNYMRVNQYSKRSVSEVVEAETTTNSFSEYLPLTADIDLMSENKEPEIVSSAPVSNLKVTRRANSYRSNFEVERDSAVTLKVFAFPYLKVVINGSAQKYLQDEKGRVMINVTAGHNDVHIFY